jgi:hypothetical protein
MNRIEACLRLNVTRKTLLILLICWVIFGFSGCFSAGTLPQSTANLYPQEPRQCSIPGSTGQAITSRTMPATFDELFDATIKIAFRRGLEVDYKDIKKGKLSGKGYWQHISGSGPVQLTVVFAAYIEEIDRRPTTKLTIVMDNLSYSDLGTKTRMLREAANNFVIDVQKLLATVQ